MTVQVDGPHKKNISKNPDRPGPHLGGRRRQDCGTSDNAPCFLGVLETVNVLWSLCLVNVFNPFRLNNESLSVVPVCLRIISTTRSEDSESFRTREPSGSLPHHRRHVRGKT